jgi:hypothetical protein
MQRHLEDGCERCTKLYNVWKTIAEVAGREVFYEPPQPDVRIGKAVYATARRKYVLPVLAKMIPLVFDNYLDSFAAPVRSAQIQAPTRHLLHRTRSWAVDLRLESEGGGQMSVAGQVLRPKQKSAQAVAADVILMQGDTLLAQTSTNEFGEFQLQCKYEKNLNIYLDIPGRQPLGIALPDPNT